MESETVTTTFAKAATLAAWGITIALASSQLPGSKIVRSYKQTGGDIVVQEFTRDEADGTHTNQFFVSSTKTPNERRFLFQHHRGATLLISPDASHIAINHYASSTDGVVIVFERVKDLEYRELIGDDVIRKKALHAASQSLGHKTDINFDHLYVDCIAWSAGSSALLVRLSGHNEGALEDWYCIFDIKTKAVSLDLSLMNKGTCIRRGE